MERVRARLTHSVFKSPAPAHHCPAALSRSCSKLRFSMSTAALAPTSIVAPSTPTTTMALIPNSAGTISPKAFTIEARLNLSLDELIKERKKEVKKEIKAKKHESVKKETMQQSAQKPKKKNMEKQPSQNAMNAKKIQTEKRKTLVNKNRKLQPLPETITNTAKKSKSATATPRKTKAAKKLAAKQKGDSKDQQRQSVRKVTSLKSNGAQTKSQQKKKQVPQQPKQQHAQQQKQKQKQPAQMSKKQTQVLQPKASNTVQQKLQTRQVIRSSKNASKIRIMIRQTQPESRKQQRAKKPQVMTVVLPGRVPQSFSKATTRAQQVVKRVTQIRKQKSSKNGSFVVRKPFVSRKN